LEVRESRHQSFVELFYQAKAHPEGKPRFRVVVVKVLDSGSFVSTAMTTNAMKKGRTLYRKGETK
jgi:pyridoxine/pyridoxamine 5'-phosphate oxidase